MWVARWLFVGCFLCACLGMIQAWAMAETIERGELRLRPLPAVPVKHAGMWTPPADRLAAVIDEIESEHGAAYCWALLMREAARVKQNEMNAKIRKAEDDVMMAHEG